MDMQGIMQQIAIMAVPVLMAVTIHEVAHGYVADYFGDHTARRAGRLTLNPLRHLDLLGTAVFFITRMIGWAKPIPINPGNLADPRRNMLWIAVAGPAANLLLAAFSAFFYHVLTSIPLTVVGARVGEMVIMPMIMMAQASVVINLALGFFNLIPIPPLDGGRILSNLLPASSEAIFIRLEPYGFLIVMLLLFSNVIELVIVPLISFSAQMMIGVKLL
ncbi:MAG: site-2 protease family protein [Deltaproteobacteria bacterium]|nr:site-2 protease family protein [Candidatus Anaeroferrophillus wilburensis]MBN2888302.1 site-2 protease family protein [Deltaproteobacteria bacterium]